jgi:formylglycine-generating enzyme required for sulfatase activity
MGGFGLSTLRYLFKLMLPMALLPGMLQAQSAALADFDDNGTVSFADFILFAQTFGSGQTRFDLDGSGTVNFPDFVAFSQVFGGKVGSGIVETFPLPGGEALKMVWIDPGTFKMGSPDTEPGREDDEGPEHAVTISRGFYLGKYEVTQRQWEEVVGSRPWIGKDFVQDHPDHPAAFVSWNDVKTFIHRLNIAEGDSIYRLPTEAEWEYAARAGTTTSWPFGNDSTRLGDYTWYFDSAWSQGEAYPHPVGTKLPNPWGLYDIHGNVWEWVQDWYSSSYYNVSPGVDPQGPAPESHRSVRGGAFSCSSRYLRSAERYFSLPSYLTSDNGLRLVRQRP